MANYTVRRAMMTRPQRNKAPGLPAGVYRYIRRRELSDGTEAEYLVFSTRTTVKGRNIVTTFSAGRMPVPRAKVQQIKESALRHRMAWEATVHRSRLRL